MARKPRSKASFERAGRKAALSRRQTSEYVALPTLTIYGGKPLYYDAVNRRLTHEDHRDEQVD